MPTKILILSLFLTLSIFKTTKGQIRFEPQIDVDDTEVKQRLPTISYWVTQHKWNENWSEGQYVSHFEKGIYNCIVCYEPLFSSEDKVELVDNRKRAWGWAAFNDTIGNIVLAPDTKMYYNNIGGRDKTLEIVCDNCGAHLGHKVQFRKKQARMYKHEGAFYKINSASLNFTASIDQPQDNKE